VSDVYSFGSDPAAPSDAQRRRLLLQQMRQAAASAAPGQTTSAPALQSIPNVDPSAAPVVQASAGGGMLQALRVANAAPSAAVAPDQSSPAQPAPPIGAPQPAGMLQALRDALHSKIDADLDAARGPMGFDENGKPSGLVGGIANVNKVLASYVPGPAGDAVTSAVDSMADRQSIKDTMHAGVDAALDPTRSRAVRSVARGTQQGLSGLNEGLGNAVFALPDALDRGTDYVAGKLAAAFGAAPPTLPRAHDRYNQAFVEPAGQPQTKTEQQIRGTARSFGNDVPALLLGGGLATAGARSGITLAEQEAPGLLDMVRAPAVGIAAKLKEMIPNLINGLHPTNIANAVRASNMQGAADTVLQQVATHPNVAAFGDLTRDWRNEKKREAQE
jgi:hypothetical protein